MDKSDALYSFNETGDLKNYEAILPLFVGIIVTTFISCFSYKRFKSNFKRAVASFIGSYTLFFLALFVISLFSGDVSGFLMWLPVLIIFAIPFMFPLIFGCWLCVTLILNEKRITTHYL